VADASGDAPWDALTSAALDAIRRDEVRKVVVARRVEARARAVSLCALARRLRLVEPTAIRFAVTRGARAFVGASPELLVARSGTRVVADALAGTRPLGPGAYEALLASDKDRREHDEVVRAVRKGLAPAALALVVDPPRLRSLANVVHLASRVAGRLRMPPAHVLDLVAAIHPSPAVSGAPRDQALAILAVHEGFARGWYAGPVGWFDRRGDGAFAVAIRSALLDLPGDRAWLFAGAGLVRGSVPLDELRETEAKLRTMRALLAGAGGGEREEAP
jgi:isochorismate synthase